MNLMSVLETTAYKFVLHNMNGILFQSTLSKNIYSGFPKKKNNFCFKIKILEFHYNFFKNRYIMSMEDIIFGHVFLMYTFTTVFYNFWLSFYSITCGRLTSLEGDKQDSSNFSQVEMLAFYRACLD